MARIEGVELPREKRTEYGLTYLFGIGLKTSRDVLTKVAAGLHVEPQKLLDKRIKDLTDEEIAAIQKEISSNYVAEGDLRKEIKLNIKRLQDIGSYRGLRHKKSLPVRGQRTRTNARTRKGPRQAAIALKRKITKK